MDQSFSNWLVVLLLIFIVVLMIIIGTGMAKGARKAHAVSLLDELLNPKMRFVIPKSGENFAYDEVSPKSLTSFKLFLKDVENTKTINLQWLKNMIMKSKGQTRIVDQIVIPKTIAYALAITNYKRNEDVEKLMSETFKNNDDPFKQGTSSDPEEFIAYKYSKMSYHLIWYKYLEKNSLLKNETLHQNATMRQTIDTFLADQIKYTPSPTYTTGDDLISDGLYYDRVKMELGFVDTKNMRQGGLLILLWLEAIYYILTVKKYTTLHTLSRILFERIKSNAIGEFKRLVGTQRRGASPNYLADWLKVVAMCHSIDSSLNLGSEYYKQLSRLSPSRKIHNFPTNLPRTVSNEPLIVLRSNSESFYFIHNKNFTFEQAFNNAKLKNATATLPHDIADSVIDLTNGYMNYGCDFGPVFVDSSAELLKSLYLPGQYSIDTTKKVPSVAGALIKVTESLYYVCHENSVDMVSHGFIDMNLGIHQYSVKPKKELTTYCAFAWRSDYMIAVSKIKDNSYVVYDTNDVFVIDCSANMALTYTSIPLSTGTYINFTAKLAVDTVYDIVVSRSNNAVTIPDIPTKDFTNTVPDVTVNPKTATTITYFKYNNSHYFVDSLINVSKTDSALNMTAKTVNYPFKNTSFSSYAVVPAS